MVTRNRRRKAICLPAGAALALALPLPWSGTAAADCREQAPAHGPSGPAHGAPPMTALDPPPAGHAGTGDVEAAIKGKRCTLCRDELFARIRRSFAY